MPGTKVRCLRCICGKQSRTHLHISCISALSSVCHHILRSSPIIVKNLHMQGLITRRNQEEESTYAECDGSDHTRTITLITHISQRPGASSGQIMPRPSRVISVVFLSTYHAFRSISILSLSLSHPPQNHSSCPQSEQYLFDTPNYTPLQFGFIGGSFTLGDATVGINV